MITDKQRNGGKLRAVLRLSHMCSSIHLTNADRWLLFMRDPVVTSALIGASRPEQIIENVQALDAAPFSGDELKAIDEILAR